MKGPPSAEESHVVLRAVAVVLFGFFVQAIVAPRGMDQGWGFFEWCGIVVAAASVAAHFMRYR